MTPAFASGRRLDADLGCRCGEVAHVPGDDRRGAGLQRACRDEHVVGLSADYSPPLCSAQRAPGLGCRQMYDRSLPPVRLLDLRGRQHGSSLSRHRDHGGATAFKRYVQRYRLDLDSAVADPESDAGSGTQPARFTNRFGYDEAAGFVDGSCHGNNCGIFGAIDQGRAGRLTDKGVGQSDPQTPPSQPRPGLPAARPLSQAGRSQGDSC